MSDLTNSLPSRRAQREAREAAERAQTAPSTFSMPAPEQSMSPTGELPSRRSLRRTGAIVETEMPTTSTDWTPNALGAPTVGTSGIAVTTLHVETFPTGEITGPIDGTGEILLTGPIQIVDFPVERIPRGPIDASAESHQPGIPRRATEALSIIGRAAPIDEKRRIPSVGQGISAGFAAFLGLLVVALVVVAIVTKLI